jgi:hypothetical protein
MASRPVRKTPATILARVNDGHDFTPPYLQVILFRSIVISMKRFLLLSLLMAVHPAFAGFEFVHPGLLQSRTDLVRLKMAAAAKQEPIYSGYEVFRTNAESQLNYKMRGPLAMVGRNPTVGQEAYDSDANAAYQCAIMWCITDDTAYADKSEAIINAWSSTLKSITGRDAVLMAGLGPFKMVNAAEILRYTDDGWTSAEIQQAEKHFREVIYPVIRDFAPFANGNWDTAAMKTMMAIGVFCNDRAMFERALRYYLNGAGDGRLTHYIINATGQCQESGRDQQHTQLGLAHLGDCCEIAWHQGLNLYGYDDNLLLKGFEYTARYNLGEKVPFVATLDRTGKYRHTVISAIGRGRFRAVFEEIDNAYATRLGIPAPFTHQVVEKNRPEGVGVPSAPRGADQVGFGTLLFARSASGTGFARMHMPPAAPGAVIARGSPQANQLRWIASRGAESYTVKRATENGGCMIIARDIAATTCTDTNVQSGEVYHYAVSAANAFGESPGSYPASICAGLPKPWTHQDVGAVAAAGEASFDGVGFTLEGAGSGLGGTNDQCQFAFAPMQGDGAIIARFVPQTSSQFSQFGLMMRETSAADAAHVSLLLASEPGGPIEEPLWDVRLTSRDAAGANTVVHHAGLNLPEPMVTYGRLTGCCWLKLARTGDTCTGLFSADGKTWTQVGTARVQLKRDLLAGLCASSRLATVTTTVRFDNVKTVRAGAGPIPVGPPENDR